MDTKKGKSYPIGKANDGEKTFLILPGEIPYLNLKTRLKGDILDKTKNVKHFKEIAKPLHYQRIQKALNIKPFTNSLASIDLSDSDDEENGNNSNRYLNDSNGVDSVSTNEYFNFSDVSSERKWLADILQETNNGGPDDVQYKHILKLHEYSKRVRHGCKNINKYMHYGAGLISTVDQYKAKEATHESQKHQVSETVTSNSLRNDVKTEIKSESRKRKRDQSVPPPVQSPLYPPNLLDDITDEPCLDLNLDATLDFHFEDDIANIPTSFDYTMPTTSMAPLSINTDSSNKKLKNKKFKDEEAKKKWEDMMTAKRKRFFIGIVKKEVGKQQRSKINRHKEMLIQCKKVAQQCAKAVRQKALYSSRIMKEQQWRMKRLARENIAYWKRSRRLDREVKKRMEKEAEEQRKIDHELVEAKRQQRKLNFLITQTELYAHFMSKKLGQVSPEEQLRILNQLDEEKNPKLISIDDYDSHVMKEMAMKNAEEAFLNERTRTKHFDVEANSSFVTNNEVPDGEHSQPQIFRGKLKGYQLKGMNWLANLYSQGISGILADEMGLGKTVQSIAFLCHIAEMYDVWGPFLIISPASTLHNWQQEIEKFVPSFKVVPYWGNPHERKILRQFWDQKDIYTKKASFHIVITSYQIVITDIKYFNRIKWQYMILDEAQAIKSTSSMRWKTLLGFSCRNRLLLSGTPIQNSMAELWALLHFIMPTLFDSHEEFNEWFSKDIESHAENKTGIDEKHLSRLHMILKPFMLRRIKKDVENELSDKIEIMVYCPLTTRQQLLYIALKQKIKIEDLIHYSVGGGDAHHVDKSFTSNLMNLVMQFRKVCNHPELFERRDAKSPITTTQIVYVIPSLIYHYNIRKQMLYIMQKYYLFNSKVIAENFKSFRDSIFNFCLLLNLSFEDLSEILQGNMFKRLEYFYNCEKSDRLAELQNIWPTCSKKFNLRIVSQNYLGNYLKNSEKYNFLLLNSCNRRKLITYGFSNNISFSLSRKKNAQEILDTVIDVVNETPEFLVSENPDRPLISVNFQDVPMSEVTHFVSYLPSFLFGTMPKIRSPLIQLYCPSRAAAWDQIEMTNTIRYNCLLDFWSRTTNNSFSEASQSFTLNFETTDSIQPVHGWSSIFIPDKETLVTDAGKLSVLDNLLKKLKKEGHRVLIYSQMTKMIDLLEEYMWHRHHKYMRLDGSSKISERRDMVADFQARSDIFVFLLSTRAGGLGINLTAADTVIFYDSDWNPTVDQQAMDRAHRLGQTKQVTVYRLICKGTIEERILQRAREKNEIQKLVISGGNFKPDSLKPKEVVSLLLDEEELIQRVHKPAIKTEAIEEVEKKKKSDTTFKTLPALTGKYRTLNPDTQFEDQFLNVDSTPTSPRSTTSNDILTDDLSESSYFDDTDSLSNKYTVYNVYGSTVKPKPPLRGQSKRGRPRGSRSRTSLSRINTINSTSSGSGIYSAGPEANIMENTNTVLSPNLTENQAALTGSRRGPGRPRLKPSGPANTSSRGTYKPRKPAKPLPVPIPSDPSSNFSSNLNQNIGSSNSNLYSSYVFDFPDQIPDT